MCKSSICLCCSMILLLFAYDIATSFGYSIDAMTNNNLESWQPDLTVAKDGSGNYTTVGAAVAAAPNNIRGRKFIIYIKEGSYEESIIIESTKINLCLRGDGMEATIIRYNKVASKDASGKYHTYNSATVGVNANGFVMRDITIENYADQRLVKQAVALRVSSSYSAFYKCKFLGYQDTLYIHSGIQFYRECDIQGTIDFICGGATAVLQKCIVHIRGPLHGQDTVIAAHKRESSEETTGMVFQGCFITHTDAYQSWSKHYNYLGRPWGQCARTIYMQCKFDWLINIRGYIRWNNNSTRDSTVDYEEYQNSGHAAARNDSRVKWPGLKIVSDGAEISRFTVGSFIDGNSWLRDTGIPYDDGLYND